MDTIVTTVAGAGEFNLSLDLEVATGASLPGGLDTTFIIYNISYANDGAAHAFHAWLLLPAGAATERIDIIDVTGETGFAQAGCRIPVPRTTTAPWTLRFTTTGKVADGSLVVSTQMASVELPT